MSRPDHVDDVGDIISTVHRSTAIRPSDVTERLENQKTPELPSNVSGIDLSKIDVKDYPLIEKFLELTREITKAFDEITYRLLSEELETKGEERQKTIQQLEESQLDQPRFRIFPREQLDQVADEINLPLPGWQNNESTSKCEWFCIFTLPTHIDRYWYKSDEMSSRESQDIDFDVFPIPDSIEDGKIKWGNIYIESINLVWGLMDIFQDATGLTLSRLNVPFEHKIEKYYYVWGIS